ncbi:hypothetical protein DF165_12990 [Burkholderia cenocepacia]|uniref:hypothetical protein n=1 Tax=Burkholderia cepacia complex TaxID=87882 RepID=UPI000F5B175E|nr:MULTISPECIES: hypothetical protein [Burkholderia cepacia complex]RQT96079.1 hypothetical protein DF165_12990 [Burkholderia cenocepacia]
MSSTSEVHFVSVQRKTLDEARDAARELRAMYDALTPFERGLAAKQIAPIKRLVDAVDKL